MRIAQVAPLFERVPPKTYGGTERVVSYLTEELVDQGHEVTLFASGDSVTKARLIAPCPESLRLSANSRNEMIHHVVQLQMVQERLREFDIIHYHTDFFHYPLSRINKSIQLTTLHGRLDNPDLQNLYNTFPDMPLVSISDSQKKPLSQAGWLKTVYHGLPKDLYDFHEKKGEYLAFLGRICPEKGIEKSIELAKQTGIPLKIAAKVDEADAVYYENVVRPQLDHPLIEYVGEIGEKEKNEFLGNALCLMFLIDWPEPFGLVMTEAMACGTPVVALNRGSVPEILDNGISGIVIDSPEQARQAIMDVATIDRQRCREKFEERFSVQRMTSDYLELYHQLTGRKEDQKVFAFASEKDKPSPLKVV